MRSNVAEYSLISAPSLPATLALLAEGVYTPIAGGTELMVALAAGRLPQKQLISINHLRELRFIDATPDAITLGSGTTYTDIRRHAVLAADFPLLVQAASWTGGIANQNRGTLGGNIVNGSPAADSPPALLAYDATVTLISAAGTRTMPYSMFHLGYKKSALAPDELLYSITLPRKFSGYHTYIRKVGPRNAQAISKVALACVALLEPTSGRHPERSGEGAESRDPRISFSEHSESSALPSDHIITDVRIGAASLRETPTRCIAAEQALLNQPITPATIAAARTALIAEARPIDDIRSTARYRAAIAANLLEEFLHQLAI